MTRTTAEADRPQRDAAADDAVAAFASLAHRPAAVTIDVHRGHLDPVVATLPLAPSVASPLVARIVTFLDRFRMLGLPVIHVVTSYRNRAEITVNPYWRFQSERTGSPRSRIADHNVAGMPGLELMPGVRKGSDIVIEAKKRYDCFAGTDLDRVLRRQEADSVLLLGVNTNSCVIATAMTACVLDYAVFVVEEGVQTMFDSQTHDAARLVIASSFGWLIHVQDVLRVLEAR